MGLSKKAVELGAAFGLHEHQVYALVESACRESPAHVLDAVGRGMEQREDDLKIQRADYYNAMLAAIALGEGRVTLRTKEMLEFLVAQAVSSDGTITEQRFLERMASRDAKPDGG